MYELYEYIKRNESHEARRMRVIDNIVSIAVRNAQDNAIVAFNKNMKSAFVLALSDISEQDDIKIDDESWNIIKKKMEEAVKPFELVEEIINDIRTLKIIWR